MKRRICILLMLLVFLLATPIGASAATLDGLEITTKTNKKEYKNYDSITVTHTITNTNDTAVTNLKLENQLPEGYTADKKAPLANTVDSLAPGGSIHFSSTLKSEISKSDASGNKVLTIILYCLGGLVVVGGGTATAIILVRHTKKKKATKVLSVLLCVAMLGAVVAPASAAVQPSKLDLTHDVTVDGAVMTLHTIVTYDPIPGEKVNLAVEASNMLFDAATSVYHVVAEMDALSGTLLYTEKATEGECEVKDVNGNVLLTRKFKPANIWKVDDFGLIVGMNNIRVAIKYETGMLYETCFQVNNICEKNMEGLSVDKGDTDNDGVLNFIENMYHTNPGNPDSDGDTLPDYEEMAILGTDVMKADTDGNGVSDADEDTDGDTLTNSKEILEHKTDPILVDSDGDALSDCDELHTHKTNPTLADTDEDGRDDGWELENGYDPLTVNTDFPPEETPVPDHVTVESDGEVVITPLEDDLLVNEDTPGYIGVDPVQVELEQGHTADIHLEFDPSQMNDDETPTLYYVNEETQNYEEVPSTVSGDKVEATIQKSGVYVLLNSRFVEDVWTNDIFKPSDMNKDGTIDVVFVVDRSQSMDSNDPNAIRKDVTKEFIRKLRPDKDQAAIVQFTAIAEVIMQLSNDQEALCNTVDMIENSDGGGCDGTDQNAGTNGSAGIRAAIDILNSSTATYKYIIFLTDGEDTTVSEDYGDEKGEKGLTGEAKAKGIIIHTVGLVGSGGVDTDLLKRIAKGTNGNYYLASVGEDAENNSELVAIYDEIESVTIDRHLDSNNDGISDYYTRLICDGKLGTGTGVRNLFGEATYEEIQANADFDGDGLTNGQELQIIENDRGVFVKVVSLPYTKDSDTDGLSDQKEQNGATSPLKKNGNVLQADVAWLTNSENFESDAYLELYNENVLVRGAVWIGNIFFGTTLDQTNLYRQVLLDYFYAVDQTLLSSNSEATFNAYVEAFNEAFCSEMEAGLVSLLESGDINALEAELKEIYKFVDAVGDIHGSADDTKLSTFVLDLVNNPAKTKKSDLEKLIAGVKKDMKAVSNRSDLTPDLKNAKLNELTQKMNDYIGDSRILKGKIKGRTDIFKKIGKVADVVDKVMFVIDLAQHSWTAYQNTCNSIAALDTIESNLYILECIIANSNNTYLTGAAKEIRFYLNDTFSKQTNDVFIALRQADGVLTHMGLELAHSAIASAGLPGAIIEAVRLVGNLVFNLDDISKAASETVALAASADILGQNYLDHLEGGYAIKQDDLWVAYTNYTEDLYVSILNLAKLRSHAELKMAEWKKDETVVANCKKNSDRCNQLDNLYNAQYYIMCLS